MGMTLRTDPEWMKAATTYRNAKAQLDMAKQAEADAREALIHAAGEQDAAGFGVSVKIQKRKGSIDYKAAVSELLPDVSVEKWRKPETSFFKVDVSKE